MKVCQRCGEELDTKDGDNMCRQCENDTDDAEEKAKARRARARQNRRIRAEAMKACGLVRVRGALGGTYWE